MATRRMKNRRQKEIWLTLSSYNTGFDNEADFDKWASYVAEHIDEKTGLDVMVQQTRFAKPEQFEDSVSGATEEQEERIHEAVRSMWDDAAWDVSTGTSTQENITATRKRQSAPKGRGGSSGGGNPRDGGRASEEQHEDAMRVLNQEYRQGVLGLAQEVNNLVKNENMDESDALHQVVDGSYWVIYTHANFQVLMCTENHDAYSEDFGEPPVSGNDINWAALAYAAMARDVSERMGAGDLEESRGRMRSPIGALAARRGRR